MAQNRIKVLKFVTNFSIGGTERQFAQLVREIDLDRFDLNVACFSRTGRFLSLIEPRGIPINEFSIRRLYNPWTWHKQLQFAMHLRRNRIDVVHSYGFYPNLFTIPAARLSGVPVTIASIRDTGEMLADSKRWIQKEACRWATSVLTNAEAVRDQLISDGYDGRKVSVIRNGIIPTNLSRRERGGPLRAEFGLPDDAPIVSVISRLNGLKGIQYFLDAIPAILQQSPAARFLIVGDGAERPALEAHAQRLALGNAVIFTGSRLDVQEILCETSISVLPSLSEGLSNVLIESMAAGVPVVATRVGGNPEIVDDEVTGFLIPPRNSAALTHAVVRLLSNPELAIRMGQAGREHIGRRFSLERSVRETEQLYMSLLQGAGRLTPRAAAV